jgi:hypothetical protein
VGTRRLAAHHRSDSAGALRPRAREDESFTSEQTLIGEETPNHVALNPADPTTVDAGAQEYSRRVSNEVARTWRSWRQSVPATGSIGCNVSEDFQPVQPFYSGAIP